MITNPPIIKFSPFEALLIGEKNRVLKRQPMKNTIFVSRLNRQCKTINLRVLFDLEKSENKRNDVIFKMPQRVQEFLKSRKKATKDNTGCRTKKEILCYEFEGRTISEAANSKRKKTRCKANFKRKRKKKEKYRNKAVRKFPKPTTNNYIKLKALFKKNSEVRGKSNSTSPRKKKYVESYVLYLKENGRLLRGLKENEQVCKKLSDTMPNVKLDTTEDDVSKELVVHFLTPDDSKLNILNFDDDNNLLDIVYESFPKKIKFECDLHTSDFSEALIRAGLVKPENNSRHVKNGLVKNELMKILKSPFPLVKCQRMNNIEPNQCIVIGRCASEIDEVYLKKNHDMKSESLESFFFNSGEGKSVFGGKSLRPKRLIQNSCF